MARPGGTGKKKMEIRKIENKLHLKTAFTKRRQGLFKKVAAFCNSSGTKAAVFAFSPFGRTYSFGSPSELQVIDAFYAAQDDNVIRTSNGVTDNVGQTNIVDHKSEPSEECQEYWWEKPAADVEFFEIDEFKESLSEYKNNLISRIEDLQRRRQAMLNLFV